MSDLPDIPSNSALHPPSVWEQLAAGFPKRRHVYVYRLPLAVPLLSLSATVLLISSILSYTTGGVVATGLSTFLTLYFARLHQLTKRCCTIEQAAERFGQHPEGWTQIIADRGIGPEFVVDGVPVYNPALLSEAALLLRPASSENSNLLWPVVASSINEGTLVRAAGGDSEPAVPVASAEALPQPLRMDQVP